MPLEDGFQHVDTALKAEAVRRVYRLAADGRGVGSIARILNKEKVPPLGRGKHWARSYVWKILANRAVVGEYQPHIGRGKKRRPDGPPVKGYFPAAVTEEMWWAARAAAEARRGKDGRPAKRRVNIFAGLLRDARYGGGVLLMDKGHGPLLVSTRGMDGLGERVSFPLGSFEASFLSKLAELDPREVLGEKSTEEDRVLALSAKATGLEARIGKVRTLLETDEDLAPVVATLRKLQAELDATLAELDVAKREAASPASAAWGECKSLLDAEDRVKLRAALRRVVSEIYCLFVARGRTRLAALQVHFHRSDSVRSYIIEHTPGAGGNVPKRAASWRAWSLADVTTPLDLRKRGHAEAVRVKLLEAKLPE